MSAPSAASRVAIYARVSTLLHGQDPANQTTVLADYAASRGFVVTNTYIDRGISGTREKRPGLDAMLTDARRRRFDILLVTALDRVGRSTLHVLRLISELEHLGVALVSLRENIDLGSPIGRMTVTVLAGVAALEAELVRERVKQSIAARRLAAAAAGVEWRTGRPSVLDAEVVAKVREMRAAGRSLRAIAVATGISKSSVARAAADVPERAVPDAQAGLETTAEKALGDEPA